MNRAVFLDRDGTINKDVGYIADPRCFELIPGAVTAMNRLRAAGFCLPLVTNQAGVGQGLMTEQQLIRVLEAFQELLRDKGTAVDGAYYCPHDPILGKGSYKRPCDCRKPGHALLTRAVSDLAIDLGRSYMVGDHWSDAEAGLRAGCRVVLLRTGHGPQEIEKLTEAQCSQVDHIADDLSDAADWILKQE
jgi:D-glycero-D-manno-heptose 1,7-bisphosphate phosphatase